MTSSPTWPQIAAALATVIAVGTRAAAVDTAYQPNTTQDVLVCAPVKIATGALGGKIEAMTDASNPPTTVVGTFSVDSASITAGGQLTFLVKAGNYYKLKTTQTAGTPTFSVIGNVYEYTL